MDTPSGRSRVTKGLRGRYLLLKITQLVELLSIRHSVFLMGTSLDRILL